MNRNWILTLSVSILMCAGTALAQTRTRDAQPRTRVENPGAGEDSKLRYAAAQHEIISIMLQEGEFDGIQEAFQQILDLGISGEQERLLMLEAWWVAESLGKAGQHDLAHQTIESSLRVLQDSQHLFNLKMLDGKLYKNQGLLSEAVQAYRSAQQFRQPEEQ